MPALAEQDARLDVSVLSRIKLFYRPLSMVAASLPALRFAVARAGKDLWLTIHNPAPVHQTLGSLTLHAQDALFTLDAPMIAPFENARVRVPPAALSRTPSTGWRLKFTVIDDDGNWIAHEQALNTNQNASLAAHGEVRRDHLPMEPKAPLPCGAEAPNANSEFFTESNISRETSTCR